MARPAALDGCCRRAKICSVDGTDFHDLPEGLPVPEDDGAADGLTGRALPPVTFEATSGDPVDLFEAAQGTLVLYVYPRTGTPGQPLPAGWDEIPGARGCTPE